MKAVLEPDHIGLLRVEDRHAQIARAIDGACRKIAPLWPLKSFVAVNPFLGFSDKSFHEVCATFRRVNRTNVLMTRGFYRKAVESKVIEDQDLEAALSAAPSIWPVPRSIDVLKNRLADDQVENAKPTAVVATIAEVLDRLALGDRQASRTGFMIDEIAKFCASYYDEGQALLAFPLKGKPLYTAWLEMQRFDRNAEVMGLRHFRKTIARMPKDPIDAIQFVLEALGIPQRATEEYLYRALFDINGWASYIRHLVWKKELQGAKDDSLIQLLAIRVVWGYALFLERSDAAFTSAWAAAMQEAAKLPHDQDLSDDPGLALDALLHEAYERSHQRALLNKLSQAKPALRISPRAPIQAAFCIDVRSEVFRRALESVCPAAETFALAGFFGAPLEFVPLGEERGANRLPVLLNPAFKVSERVESAEAAESLAESRRLQKRVLAAWKRFKQSAVSCFAYVEALGIFALFDLVRDSLGLRRPERKPTLAPSLDPHVLSGRTYGISDTQKLQIARAVLKAMSLTKEFAPLVLLVGHGGATINNPHASGLDCGACGGHAGDVNARVGAKILNDSFVREGLKADGIVIPADTWFVGALHNTTTDEISLFDLEAAPAELRSQVAELETRLRQASELARAERSLLLGSRSGEEIMARSSDWSQVRPEWGLAGNSAFLIGPRSLTANANLGGRAFLHTYDWKADEGFAVLELIMTAPMIVGSWINLQYFAFTTNNPVFGAGNKVLHNVTGALGVIEGNGGDLKVGLPWQSVHDGHRFVHQPLRMNVVIAAPKEAINAVIRKHASVRNLVDHQWIHLYAQADDGTISGKYAGNFEWV